MKATQTTGLCFSDEREKQSFFIDEIFAHQKLLRSVISKILTNPEDIEDALQECLLQAWASMESLRDRGSLTSWLCVIARNSALDVLRKKGGATVSLSEPVSGTQEDGGIVWADTLISRIPGPEEIAIARFSLGQVMDAYRMLPVQYRLQLYLRCYMELEVAEINSMLNISERTRRNACFRAKQAVRRNYERLQEL